MFPEGAFGMGNCDCSPWKPDSELVFSSQGTDTPCDLCLPRSTLGSNTWELVTDWGSILNTECI